MQHASDMTILLLAGSPSERSRSAALLEEVRLRLRARAPNIERLDIRTLPAEALLRADFHDPDLVRATELVARAHAVVIATPIYKAAYSGVLKAFLDLLPQTALRGKVVLPLATGGSPHHMLAVDYALRPVLQSLSARHILPGVYATDAQVALLPEGGRNLHADIAERLDDAVGALVHEIAREVAAVQDRQLQARPLAAAA